MEGGPRPSVSIRPLARMKVALVASVELDSKILLVLKTDVALTVGFSSSSAFATAFSQGDRSYHRNGVPREQQRYPEHLSRRRSAAVRG